ncbi:YcnI family protein [Saxibacter everestensis]|uniref:YcnI family protein n=1 Tax=Saxibacter everestensis TaxID=2909229 RepID=A0ABY8QSR2_9MICO|nr:YcnI family protein [Brevibacteriaceae bacterium ZFBP1038]
MNTIRRISTAAAVAALVVLPAAAASAHVRVIPDSTAADSYSELAFRVPNESDTAGTVRVKVTLPTATPLTSVSTKPVPGWTAKVTEGELPKPIEVDGATITKAPLSVTWTADKGTQIAPGQYQTFPISAGPLPKEGLTLTLPAEQTYSDGEVVSWSERTKKDGSEPELPAPAFQVTAAESEGHHDPADKAAGSADTATEPDDVMARWLGSLGLAVGIIAVAIALLGRRGKAA